MAWPWSFVQFIAFQSTFSLDFTINSIEYKNFTFSFIGYDDFFNFSRLSTTNFVFIWTSVRHVVFDIAGTRGKAEFNHCERSKKLNRLTHKQYFIIMGQSTCYVKWDLVLLRMTDPWKHWVIGTHLRPSSAKSKQPGTVSFNLLPASDGLTTRSKTNHNWSELICCFHLNLESISPAFF